MISDIHDKSLLEQELRRITKSIENLEKNMYWIAEQDFQLGTIIIGAYQGECNDREKLLKMINEYT